VSVCGTARCRDQRRGTVAHAHTFLPLIPRSAFSGGPFSMIFLCLACSHRGSVLLVSSTPRGERVRKGSTPLLLLLLHHHEGWETEEGVEEEKKDYEEEPSRMGSACSLAWFTLSTSFMVLPMSITLAPSVMPTSRRVALSSFTAPVPTHVARCWLG